MHQLYDIEIARALAADRRTEIRRAAAGRGRTSPRRVRIALRARRAGPGPSA